MMNIFYILGDLCIFLWKIQESLMIALMFSSEITIIIRAFILLITYIHFIIKKKEVKNISFKMTKWECYLWINMLILSGVIHYINYEYFDCFYYENYYNPSIISKVSNKITMKTWAMYKHIYWFINGYLNNNKP